MQQSLNSFGKSWNLKLSCKDMEIHHFMRGHRRLIFQENVMEYSLGCLDILEHGSLIPVGAYIFIKSPICSFFNTIAVELE